MHSSTTRTFLSSSDSTVTANQSAVLSEQHTLLRQRITEHGGRITADGADGLTAEFAAAAPAARAAVAAQRELSVGQDGSLLAIGLHTGPVDQGDGAAARGLLSRCQHIAAVANPGQILISQAMASALVEQAPDQAMIDLGAHRLADLMRAEQISQLAGPGLPADFPPLRALNAYTHNLPIQPTLMVGREREVAELGQLLLRPGVRLVTLLGPSGTGKTRLSIQVAANLLKIFRDGVFFVALAPVNQASVVISTIAQTLGVRETNGQSLVETLADFFADREALLILDNFEQVLASAPAIIELLQRTAGLKLLVTSQTLLRVPGEEPFALPSLSVPNLAALPPLADIAASPAVALFIECAQGSRPSFDLTAGNVRTVVELCARLAGLPLAIELVAAHSDRFSPHHMLAMIKDQLGLDRPIDNRSSREHTLRHVLDWSYGLLDEEDQTLFSRLGVFSGGCTLAAAEAICYETGNLVKDVLEGVDSLLNRHLLLQEELANGDLRYIMLDAVHEYTRARLAARGESQRFYSRHAAYYLELAEEAAGALTGPDQEIWLNQLESEHHNLRAALSEFGAQGAAEQQLRMAGALGRFWMLHGHLSEGRQWLSNTLDRAGEAAPAARALAMRALGLLALKQGDYDQAAALHHSSLSIERQGGNLTTIAALLNNLGVISAMQGRVAEATGFWDECQAIQQQAGDLAGSADTLNNLGVIAHEHGDYARAADFYERSLAICRELGDLNGITISLQNLGELALLQGNQDRATALFDEGLDLARRIGNQEIIAAILDGLGKLAHARGDRPAARRSLLESLQIRQELGDRHGLALSFEELAIVAADDDLERAAALLAGAGAIREAINSPVTPVEQERFDRLRQRLDGGLPPAALEAALERGRAASADDLARVASARSDVGC